MQVLQMPPTLLRLTCHNLECTPHLGEWLDTHPQSTIQISLSIKLQYKVMASLKWATQDTLITSLLHSGEFAAQFPFFDIQGFKVIGDSSSILWYLLFHYAMHKAALKWRHYF